ncbi:MAG: 7TM diverse intracellular signaling domain-containing protein, partial [Spirochaetota bacterium]
MFADIRFYCSKLLYIILACIVFLFSCKQPYIPEAQAGTLDLSKWNFAEKPIVSIEGEWEFYWKQFIPSTGKNINRTGLIPVPSYWNNFQRDGKNLTSFGYASYRLRVKLPQKQETYSLKFSNMGTAYRVLLNGKTVFEAGKVTTSAQGFQAAYRTCILDIPKMTQDLEIIVHIANYTHIYSGFWYEAYLGVRKELHEKKQKVNYFSFFLFGSFLLIGIHHLSIYSQRKKDKSELYFGIFAILFSIRPLVIEEFEIYQLLPHLPWEFVFRLEYLTFYLGTSVVILFIASIFQEVRIIWLDKILVGTSLFLTLLIFITPIFYLT